MILLDADVLTYTTTGMCVIVAVLAVIAAVTRR